MQTNPYQIVLVDDAAVDRFIFVRSVKLASILSVIREFENGMDAVDYFKSIERVKSKIPDLIVLDLSMPIMSGFEVLQAIKSMSLLKDVPVVILTSSGNPADIQNTFALGASLYLTKPITSKSLMDIAGLLPTIAN